MYVTNDRYGCMLLTRCLRCSPQSSLIRILQTGSAPKILKDVQKLPSIIEKIGGGGGIKYTNMLGFASHTHTIQTEGQTG